MGPLRQSKAAKHAEDYFRAMQSGECHPTIDEIKVQKPIMGMVCSLPSVELH